MDFSSSAKKSPRSTTTRNTDAAPAVNSDHDASTSHSDFIVKINGEDRDTEKFRRATGGVDDPPSRLIGEFLNKQKHAGGEMSLDMDLEMDELRNGSRNNSGNAVNNIPKFPESPLRGTNNNSETVNNIPNPRVSNSRELKVSFQQPNNKNNNNDEDDYDDDDDDDELEEIRLQQQQQLRRKSSNLNNLTHSLNNSLSRVHDDRGGTEVLKCTSFQRRAPIMRTRTQQSRLIDPPEVEVEVSLSGTAGKSGQYRSGLLLARPSGIVARGEIEEEDDSLYEEDNPDDFRRAKLDALTLVQWISLVSILSALICTLLIDDWKRKVVRGLHFWEWEVLVLVLICGRLVSGWGIRFIVFFIERNFLLRKRVLYFVYGIRKPVQNCIWLGLVLIAWHYMFDEKVEGHNRFLRVLNKLMVCMLVATSLWLVKTLMVKVLASSFHVKKFFDRIQEALFNQYVIETLSGPPLVEMQNIIIEEEKTLAEVNRLRNAGANMPPELGENVFSTKSERLQKPPPAIKIDEKEHGISIDHLHRLNPKNVSAWNMKRLMKIVRLGTLSTLDEQLHDMNTKDDESTTQIRSEIEAKRAARKIFLNVAKTGSKFIYLQDLMRFLREDQAVKTMSLLEGSPGDEKISKGALKTWVVNAFRERKALALTLNDTKTAVNKLHQMVNVLVGIIILIICLLILNIATSKFLVFISSQIVVVAFIFGNTCKTVFEAIIFLFVMHPFDVGDRCEIDGVQMIVEEMNILTTVFLKWDNEKVYFPNSTLSTRAISNHYRSPDMWDSIDFFIHITTPAETIAVMKQRITKYIESKKDHYYPNDITAVSLTLVQLNTIKMHIWWRHKINFQDMTERYIRKGAVIDEMVRIFKEHDVDYRFYPVDINIKNMPSPATSSRLPPTW
ncbi:putative mechanosensitive ion channel MscS, LSM domain superfamily [Helianthus annuus]|uniref:Mechanosensitive ion channel protein n=1 Tax=Helianthus annuus TaxID=4232 RepID=A0A251S886_HELAN|nr:mechanosensitive ion channel protein 6 [Helianthus annuus]KAF5764355.1 putative mechanosensitive ion channel MscS, LSM domain superfamily [Helianthus annuus]KAJ0451039.1 putative mechanosensitive ion channel MscS, LSM domain superfamily [Helianthus annuus]KAJ0455417.1 putative mechanosensitive ion channel MscS, LSM domain superfamily [Helianthus annuus]KAJ0472900.1 putative mechanosensitive ion channel MscS, LSM domain superfamily [Helianthus annuus]KAJ0648507.1 putative mechanosensitive io